VVVRYLDIRKFYPSISTGLALETWERFATEAGLAGWERALGHRLLGGHGAFNTEGNAVLTGPMFSHLIANLVLRELDGAASDHRGINYFRYVDDIVVVGNRENVRASVRDIVSRLADIGFVVHDDDSPKSLEVPGRAWLAGKDDFLDTRAGRLWKGFIGDLKRLLLVHPEKRTELSEAFAAEGYRIPVRDYSMVVRERDYLSKIRRWASDGWLSQWRFPRVNELVERARRLRDICESELTAAIEGATDLRGFDRKRRIPKLRYHAARLVYVSSDEDLLGFSSQMKTIPELRFHTAVMQAVATGGLDDVLGLGTNAAQAAAQPLHARGRSGTLQRTTLTDVEADAFAVVLFNGVSVSTPVTTGDQRDRPLLEFASRGGTLDLMKTRDSFIREVACLHGIASRARHRDVMGSAYDEDEAQILDAVEMAHGSGS
jgi:hypothetical protein